MAIIDWTQVLDQLKVTTVEAPQPINRQNWTRQMRKRVDARRAKNKVARKSRQANR